MKRIFGLILSLVILIAVSRRSSAESADSLNMMTDTVIIEDPVYQGPDTVVVLPQYIFRNDNCGRILSRMIDSMAYHDQFKHLNLTRQDHGPYFLYFINPKTISAEIIDKFVGCYICEATGEPVLIGDFNNMELERVSMVPGTKSILVKLRKGGGIFLDMREYRAGIKITALGEMKLYLTVWPYNTIRESPKDWKHFQWLDDEEFNEDESPF